MCQTSWLNDTKKSDRLEAAIPSLSPATLKFLRLVKYPTEKLPRRPSWRDCAYECVITSVPSPTKVYLVRSKQSTGWSRAGSINQRHVWCVKNGRECKPEGKKSQTHTEQEDRLSFHHFYSLIQLPELPTLHSLPVGKFIPWHTYEWTRRPHASSNGLHLSKLLLSW